jgi:predicted O-methyltransferase YrrM
MHLRYDPLQETEGTRRFLKAQQDDARDPTLPFVPPHQGDFIYLVVQQSGYARCLETGFATGSTAVYMLAATAAKAGHVVSIDNSQGGHAIDVGRNCVERSGMADRHELFLEDSSSVIRRLRERGDSFDFAFLDGWKTFDHLAYELFLLDEMMPVGGMIVFDDSYMPGVRQAIRLLCRYYAFEEVDYGRFGETWRTRLYLSLSCRSPFRPFRAFRKAQASSDQQRKTDPYFFRRLG